ncbi:MAG: YqjK-like family protein [Gallionella sp.]
MMQRDDLMVRRQKLLAKIADQRVQLSALGEQWRPALLYADRARAVFGFVRGHVVLVGGVAALFLVRRNGLSLLLRSGWRAWKIYRYFKGVSARLLG